MSETSASTPSRRTWGHTEVFGKLSVGSTSLQLGVHRDDGRTRLVVVRHPVPLTRDLPGSRLLVDEARAMIPLMHPHLAQVVEAGLDGDEVFLTTEFVSGCTLTELLLLAGPLPLGLGLQVGHEAALALHELHQFSGLARAAVHADLSLASVMLDEHGATRVIDLALPRQRRSPGLPGLTQGTPGYLAPEQIRREPLDGRVDQFALGAVLFEMLTGRRLFEGPSLDVVLHATLLGERPEAHAVNPAVPAEVSAVIARSVRRAPADRFGSLLEFARALEQAHPSSWTQADAAALVTKHFAERKQALVSLMAEAPVDEATKKSLLAGAALQLMELPLESGTAPARPRALSLFATPIPALESAVAVARAQLVEGSTAAADLPPAAPTLEEEPRTRQMAPGGLEPMLTQLRDAEPDFSSVLGEEPRTRQLGPGGVQAILVASSLEIESHTVVSLAHSDLPIAPKIAPVMSPPRPARADQPPAIAPPAIPPASARPPLASPPSVRPVAGPTADVLPPFSSRPSQPGTPAIAPVKPPTGERPVADVLPPFSSRPSQPGTPAIAPVKPPTGERPVADLHPPFSSRPSQPGTPASAPVKPSTGERPVANVLPPFSSRASQPGTPAIAPVKPPTGERPVANVLPPFSSRPSQPGTPASAPVKPPTGERPVADVLPLFSSRPSQPGTPAIAPVKPSTGERPAADLHPPFSSRPSQPGTPAIAPVKPSTGERPAANVLPPFSSRPSQAIAPVKPPTGERPAADLHPPFSSRPSQPGTPVKPSTGERPAAAFSSRPSQPGTPAIVPPTERPAADVLPPFSSRPSQPGAFADLDPEPGSFFGSLPPTPVWSPPPPLPQAPPPSAPEPQAAPAAAPLPDLPASLWAPAPAPGLVVAEPHAPPSLEAEREALFAMPVRTVVEPVVEPVVEAPVAVAPPVAAPAPEVRPVPTARVPMPMAHLERSAPGSSGGSTTVVIVLLAVLVLGALVVWALAS